MIFIMFLTIIRRVKKKGVKTARYVGLVSIDRPHPHSQSDCEFDESRQLGYPSVHVVIKQ